MKNVMLDLETLSNKSDAVVVQIAAVMFEPLTGVVGAEFNQVVDLEDSMIYGTLNGETLKWWMQQPEEARAIFNSKGTTTLESALLSFTDWITKNSDMKTEEGSPDAIVWGNGATFDNVILNNAYEELGLTPPWSFYNSRDLRTVVDLGITIKDVNPKKELTFEGIPHNALDDAKHQVKYLCSIIKSLRGEQIIE